MKRIFQFLGLLFLLLLIVLLVNTLRFTSQQITDVPPAPAVPVSDSAVARLSQAIRFRTVSFNDYALTDTTQFEQFIQFIAKSFPLIHSRLKHDVISPYGLLFEWKGHNPALKPMMLIAHYDVVPVIQGTQRLWKRPPFAGDVAEGYVYGRGSLDDKSAVMGTLEAVEYLLRTNFQPERTLFLGFGSDEETTGRAAEAIATTLQKRGIELDYLVDEGGPVKTDGMPGLTRPVALIGIGEKGYVSLNLTAIGKGGHSSMPPRQTSIGIVARAISRLEDNPFPARLNGGVQQLFRYAGPEMSFGQRIAVANSWLFTPALERLLGSTPEGDATQRTTIAPTILQAGAKDNVLPIDATVTVNFRILPGETVASVIQRVKEVIDDDRVEVKPYHAANDNDPSTLSSTDSPAFTIIHRTIKGVFGPAVVAPYVMVAKTDARRYQKICANTYRFLPIRLTSPTIGTIHGTNERIAISDYRDQIRFYVTLIRNSQP